MAGHSQFANIMYRKGAQDATTAKVFTKITREIISAAKGGMPDINSNPRLRSAVQWAREENMPRDRIEAAIKRGSGNVDSNESGHSITCAPDQFAAVRDKMEKAFGAPASAKLVWIPKNTVPVSEEQAIALLKLIETLQDFDDVQEVFSNFEIPEALLQKLTA